MDRERPFPPGAEIAPLSACGSVPACAAVLARVSAPASARVSASAFAPACALLFAIVTALCLLSPLPALAVSVGLRVIDPGGRDVPARVHLKDGSGAFIPGLPDNELLSHQNWPWMGGYFYAPGDTVWVDMAPGTARIEVGRGCEWVPARLQPVITGDTVITVTIRPAFDPQTEGWFCGDSHTHGSHNPVDYPISPETARRVAQAEDLNMLWLLDDADHFVGAPDPVSTGETILYYSFEYRHQACGHVEMLGSKSAMNWGCCVPPASVVPLLSQIWEAWAPAWDEAMCLGHPETGADFLYDSGWPGWGLGREFPVLATAGKVDGYGIASYSNNPEVALASWYDALSCGYAVAPTAGTDAVLCSYWGRPPGGYRVYVKEAGGPHSAARWVEGLKAGRVFVTNYPLIPLFTVNGVEAGGVVDILSGGPHVEVQWRIDSVLPVTTLEILFNGLVAATVPLGGVPGQQTWSGSYALPVSESGWIALRVKGITDRQLAVNSDLFAHTGIVRLRVDGNRPVQPAAAGRFYDQADSLEMFVELRGGWQNQQQRLMVLNRIQAARDSLARHFAQPPAAFDLLSPADGESIYAADGPRLVWSAAIDPDPGDHVRYEVQLADDPDFTSALPPLVLDSTSVPVAQLGLTSDAFHWWKVRAFDRGGNNVPSSPTARSFYLGSATAGVEIAGPDGGEPATPGTDGGGRGAGERCRLVLHPNPSHGWTWIEVRGGLAENDAGAPVGRLELYDAAGRRLRTLQTARSQTLWDGRDDRGHVVPSGTYWVRLTTVDGFGEAVRGGDRGAPCGMHRGAGRGAEAGSGEAPDGAVVSARLQVVH